MEKDKQLNYSQISVKIPTSLFERLEQATGSFKNKSDIVRAALEDYFENMGKVKIISEVHPLENLANPESVQNQSIKTGGSLLHSPLPRGTDPHDITMAMRAKRRGQPYDESLEPYFGSLDNG